MKLGKKSREFVDVSLSFDPHPLSKDITTLRNERAINNSIKNLILTVPTEVPFQSNIGSHVRKSLFELNDGFTYALLEEEIRRTINFSEPRVELEEVKVKGSVDDHEVRCMIKYKIVGYETVITVEQILTPTD